jgi:hypothetical protein
VCCSLLTRQQESSERDEAKVEALLQDGRDAALFLREFVVQAELNERGNLAVQFRPEHAGKEADLGGEEHPR